MNTAISRSQCLGRQYFDLQDAIKYIDDLKSRIYKAFFKKSRIQADHIQFFCITSPVVTAIAATKCSEYARFSIGYFELGYLVFCLSNNFFIDTTFCCYYLESRIFDAVSLFQFLSKSIQHLVLNWCIDSYQRYLLRKKNISYYAAGTAFDKFTNNSIIFGKHILCLNLSSCFSSFSLLVLIRKLPLHKKIKQYLLGFLDCGMFSYYVSCLDLSYIYKVYAKNKGLFFKLLNVFVFCICFEICIILDTISAPINYTENVILLSSSFLVLVHYQDSLRLHASIRDLRNLLLFHGVKLKDTVFTILSPSKSVFSNLKFMTMSNYTYFMPFTIKPSLHAQFALMKQISLILYCSASQPLLLLIIRLNQLLLLWSATHFGFTAHKTFYLIDYLIYLKLRLFVKKQGSSLSNLKAVLCPRLQCANGMLSGCSRSSDSMSLMASSYNFYRYYSFAKMFWIYKLRCISN